MSPYRPLFSVPARLRMPVWKFGNALTPTLLIERPGPSVVLSQFHRAELFVCPPSQRCQVVRNVMFAWVTGTPRALRRERRQSAMLPLQGLARRRDPRQSAPAQRLAQPGFEAVGRLRVGSQRVDHVLPPVRVLGVRSEEHTSELQSPLN